MNVQRLSLRILQVAAVLVIAGCASARTADPSLRREAAAIRILSAEEIGDRGYEIVGEAQGTSCARGESDEPSMEGARSDMRIAAAEMGAEAIMNAFCEEVGASFMSGCRRRIECRGDAIQWR